MMKNTLQILLLVLVFAICATGGYFLGDILSNLDFSSEDIVVVDGNSTEYAHSVTSGGEAIASESDVEGTEEVMDSVSGKPVVESVSTPVRDAAGKYSFEVKASVPSNDQIQYVLFGDKECTLEVLRQYTGSFTSVEPSQSGSYYLRVQNVLTGEWSDSISIKGCVKLVMFEKVNKSDLEKICNSGDYGTAPDKYSHRFSPGLVIVANGMNPDEKPVKSIADICMKVMMGTWQSVTIESLEYDSQNRVKKLLLTINY